MYTVLVPVGAKKAGVSRAVETVTGFPGSDEIEVVIVHVSKDIDVVGSDGGHVKIDHQDLSLPDAVEDAIAGFESAEIPVSFELRSGDPVDEILEIITEREVDHVIIPDKRRTPLGKVVFGGTTLPLVRDSPAPVTVVPAQL